MKTGVIPVLLVKAWGGGDSKECVIGNRGQVIVEWRQFNL